MTTLPWAVQRRYDSLYPASPFPAGVGRRGVLHSTETPPAVPGYKGGASAPHLTGVPDMAARTMSWYQHFDLDRPSRALANAAGGVETNRLGAIQVELAGYSDRALWVRGGGIYWPEAPSWALDAVAAMMRRVEAVTGIKHTALPAHRWLPGDAGYGAGNKNRMSEVEWVAFSGWCAHQHVPENSHYDVPPDIRYLIGDVPVATTTEETEMPEPIATMSLDGHLWTLDPRNLTLTRIGDPDDAEWFYQLLADMGIERRHYEVAPEVLDGWRRVYVREDVTGPAPVAPTAEVIAAEVRAALADSPINVQVDPDGFATAVAAAVLDGLSSRLAG